MTSLWTMSQWNNMFNVAHGLDSLAHLLDVVIFQAECILLRRLEDFEGPGEKGSG